MATGEVKKSNYLDTGAITLVAAPVAGTITAGPAMDMSLVKDGSLSARLTLDAETDTMTLEPVWEVSDVAGGAGAYLEVKPFDGELPTAWCQGTAGADAAVSAVVAAPSCVYAWLYSRCSVRNRNATGGAADSYRIGYNFIQKNSQ